MNLLIIESLSTTDYIIIIAVSITVSALFVYVFYNLGLGDKKGLPHVRAILDALKKPKSNITKINFASLGQSWDFEVGKNGVNRIIHTYRGIDDFPDAIEIHYNDRIDSYYGTVRVKTESIS